MYLRSLAVVALVLAGPVQADPVVRQQTSYYYIDGRSALVLSEQINQKGPMGEDGARHPARTRWEVQWKFRHNMHDGVCRMEQVAVAVGVNTIRPRWRSEKSGPAELRNRWQKLVRAVERNQEFHKQQATRAGKEIEAALLAMPPVDDCDTLTERANQAASALLTKHQSASAQHDRDTDYARKDGAALI